jgi:hypothetical protein
MSSIVIGIIIGGVIMACSLGAVVWRLLSRRGFNYDEDRKTWLFFSSILFLAGYLLVAGSAFSTFS